MKLFLSLLVGISIMGVGYWLFTNQVSNSQNALYTSDVYAYTTDDGQFNVQFADNGDAAKLSLSGVQYDLEKVESASGSTYQSADGSVVFREHQGEASVEMNNTAVFTDATLTESEAERRRVEVLKSSTQGDPNANKYDFGVGSDDSSDTEVCNAKDQDCTGGDDDTSAGVVCGAGTVLEGGSCVPDALDDDDDGDSISTEDVSVANDGGTIVIEPGATLTAAETLSALTDKTWYWQETAYTNNTTVAPTDSSQFAATFASDGTFSSKTDCNNMFGNYTLSGTAISFGPLATTMMYCVASQESVYGQMLAEATSYTITTEGNLVLQLAAGTMSFTPVVVEPVKATDYNSSRSNKSY